VTKLLEEAFTALSKLPEEDQDAIATLILEELISERQWTEAFAKSQDQMSRLADEAIEEFKKGQTKTWDLYPVL
jgi:hypothetical protein